MKNLDIDKILRNLPEEKLKRSKKIITLKFREPVAYWLYQMIHTFWTTKFDKMNEEDKKFGSEFFDAIKPKLTKLRVRE